MRSYYNIFNCINMFEDESGYRRGLRKRHSITRFFVVSGCIRLYIGDDMFDVNSGEEFIVSSHRWHGYEVVNDAKILQMIEEGYEKFYEESKPW